MLKQSFTCILLARAEGCSVLPASAQRSQLQQHVSLSRLYAQVRSDLLRSLGGGGISHLPRPRRQSTLLGVGVFADSSTERLSKQYRHLRRHLVQTDDAHIVGGLHAASQGAISPRDQDAAVTVNTPSQVGPQHLVCHDAQFKQLGTVAGGKAHHDIDTFPPALRVRESPPGCQGRSVDGTELDLRPPSTVEATP